ncbi:right-handed parallel beta-helix repeat-containing protein [Meiothermus rufus]|uniref:right-handed parallel beta-helix repeat-containing protein n=1 Tax=Meiothermus rufus TaxID=604332 RepID=UPI000423E2C0|nr:NosD domain-containing protein [Meiothermus rufus]
MLFVVPPAPLPPLAPGQTVVLEAGVHRGPWVITTPGVRLVARPGAVLDGGGRGSALQLTAEGIVVEGLTIRNTGPEDDFYEPDAAVWLWKCQNCRLEGLKAHGVPSAVRLEQSSGVQIRHSHFSGTGQAPGITAFRSDDLEIAHNTLEGFLDNLYVEYGERVRLEGNRLSRAGRYGLHLMFTYQAHLQGNHLEGNQVGSALMHGAQNRLVDNTFTQEVGPLRYGLMLQEEWQSELLGNRFWRNTIGLLSLDSRETRLLNNTFQHNGTGLLFARASDRNTLWARGNTFVGNLYDLAMDDPQARLHLEGNAFDRASPLPIPYLPSSSFALLAARQPDLSLLALSPGVLLWEAAEAQVPGLRLLELADFQAQPAPRSASGINLWGVGLALLALGGSLWLRW